MTTKLSAPLTDASATDLAAALRGRQISARELMTAVLDRIDAANPAVNAIVTLRPRDELLAEAEAMRLSGIRSDLNRSPAENQARLRAEIQEREREWQEMLRRSDERAAPTQLALARAAREREEMMERERRRQSLEARDRAERSRKAAVLNARSALSSARRLPVDSSHRR